MNRTNSPGDSPGRAAKRTADFTSENSERRDRVTGVMVRDAARAAMRRTISFGRGARGLALGPIEDSVRAATAIGGETGAFVRDAVIGVLEGTGQVVKVTAPAVREVVAGSIRGSGNAEVSVEDTGREVVEGAIVGAASVGVDGNTAALAAAAGALEAIEETRGEFGQAVKASMGGVVSGVSAIDGDVASAARKTARLAVTRAADPGRPNIGMADVAEGAVDAILEEASRIPRVDEEVVVEAAAVGVVEAAYRLGQEQGDAARSSVISRIVSPGTHIAPDIRDRLPEIAERLSRELPRGRAAWRGRALFEAARLLVRSGGIDLAASLAFFATLSLLPMVALLIMAIAVLGDSDEVQSNLTETLIYYFPTSSELIRQAVQNILNASVAIGLVSAASLVIGAGGMFASANRTVNRVFGLESERIFQATLSQTTIATLAVILFLMSIGLTVLFHAAVGFGQGIVESTGGVSTAVAFALGLVSTALPILVTAVMFNFVYHRLPNASVEWRDSAFGAIVAIAMFELGKHLFFWFTSFAAHRNIIYGPLTSAVILLMWTYVSGLIFLYGAALTKTAGDLRPNLPVEIVGRFGRQASDDH